MNAPPDIDPSDLKAVRRFLTSFRDEERRARQPHSPLARASLPLRSGIARARSRTVTTPSDLDAKRNEPARFSPQPLADPTMG